MPCRWGVKYVRGNEKAKLHLPREEMVVLNVLGINIVKRPQDHVVAAGRWTAGRVGRGIGGAARWVSEWARVSSLH